MEEALGEVLLTTDQLGRVLLLKERLTQYLAIIERAEHLHAGLPKDLKEHIGASASTDGSVDILLTYAKMPPKVRAEARTQLAEDIAMVTALMDGLRGPDSVFSAQDIEMLTGFFGVLPRFGTKSKREIIRLFEALEAGDSAHLETKVAKGKAECHFFRD